MSVGGKSAAKKYYMEVAARVAQLTSASHEQRASAAKALEKLAMNDDNRVSIARAGGIDPLVALIRSGTPEQKVYAAGALVSLAWNTENQVSIARAGGIEALVAIASSGTPKQMELAAAALWSLAENPDNQVSIARAGGIEALVAMASSGTPKQMEEAAGALCNLAINADNKVSIARAGGIEALVALVRLGTPEQKQYGVGALHILASDHPENAAAIAREQARHAQAGSSNDTDTIPPPQKKLKTAAEPTPLKQAEATEHEAKRAQAAAEARAQAAELAAAQAQAAQAQALTTQAQLQAQLQAAKHELQRAQQRELQHAQQHAQQQAAPPTPLLGDRASPQHELTAKLVALRQFIAIVEEKDKDKFKKAKSDWKLEVVRSRLVPNVLEYFGPLHHHALIWRQTVVTYVGEDGVDDGGLTADLHSSFWREVLRTEHGLFERLAEGGAYLPRADADVDRLARVGRFLLKSVLDDHPTGCGLAPFVLEYLSGAHEARAFEDALPQRALDLLAGVDGELARNWLNLLQSDEETLAGCGVTLDCFDDTLPSETPLSTSNVAMAVVAGCRRKLLVSRQDALAALQSGFTLGGKLDLRMQLAQHRTADLSLLLQGKPSLSVEDIVDCFDWTETRGSRAVTFLRELLGDASALDADRRLLLLRWCTGLNALHVGGLARRVSLRRAEGGDGDAPDGRLPEARTCYHEVILPEYSSKAVLHEKLEEVLAAFEADGSFGQQ